MKLSPEAIQEYKEAHRVEFGELLSDEEAEIQAKRIFMLFQYVFTHNENE